MRRLAYSVVVFDLDGTLLCGTTVSLLLAQWLGRSEEIAEIERLVCRRNTHRVTIEEYQRRIERKQIADRWPRVQVVLEGWAHGSRRAPLRMLRRWTRSLSSGPRPKPMISTGSWTRWHRDADLVSPLLARGAIRGKKDLWLLFAAVYGSLSELRWSEEIRVAIEAS